MTTVKICTQLGSHSRQAQLAIWKNPGRGVNTGCQGTVIFWMSSLFDVYPGLMFIFVYDHLCLAADFVWCLSWPDVHLCLCLQGFLGSILSLLMSYFFKITSLLASHHCRNGVSFRIVSWYSSETVRHLPAGFDFAYLTLPRMSRKAAFLSALTLRQKLFEDVDAWGCGRVGLEMYNV